MCLLPIKVQDPKPKAAASARIIHDTRKNTTEPVALLPQHIRVSKHYQRQQPALQNQVPTIFLANSTSTEMWAEERAPTQIFEAVHWQPPKEERRERRRSSILRDIEFIRRVQDGIGCLGDNGGKKEEEGQKKLAVPDEVLGLQHDVQFLKESVVKRDREEELGRVKAAGIREGEEKARREGEERAKKDAEKFTREQETIKREQEIERREHELEAAKRERERELEVARFKSEERGRRDSIGHDHAAAARMFWHFHTHAGVGGHGNGNAGSREEYGHGRHGTGTAAVAGYERMGVERRRSSGVSLRSVLDRVVRRDVEAELERERRVFGSGRRRRWG